LSAKREKQKMAKAEIYSHPINSKERRAHHLAHKHLTNALPSVMKHPSQPSVLLTGHAVNETWGTSATATRPNTMPTISTESGQPPWLQASMWTDIQATIKPLQTDLMAPLTEDDLRTFLQHIANSCLGDDGIQYNVIKFMCFHPDLEKCNVLPILLRFLNVLMQQQQLPHTMKTALLLLSIKLAIPLKLKIIEALAFSIACLS
jgi:hypothetical protein